MDEIIDYGKASTNFLSNTPPATTSHDLQKQIDVLTIILVLILVFILLLILFCFFCFCFCLKRFPSLRNTIPVLRIITSRSQPIAKYDKKNEKLTISPANSQRLSKYIDTNGKFIYFFFDVTLPFNLKLLYPQYKLCLKFIF